MTSNTAAVVTDTGITAPDYATILQYLHDLYTGIYGSDSILDPDSQDGQLLAALAQAIFDSNMTDIDVYNSFAPSTARGVQLSSLVKINGLRRAVPTNSQCPVDIGGTVGSEIVNGVVGDNVNLQTKWNLPSLVIIPLSGTITVTATAQDPGATPAAIDTLTQILTPQLGWQTVTNSVEASPGNPVETDAQLRIRQSKSTALPSLTVLEGIFAAVDAVQGVTRLKPYENDTDTTDADTLPPHSIAMVVEGGDVIEIATAIALKKAPGVGTFGTTSVLITDMNGVPNVIKFFELSDVVLKAQITIHPLTGYVSTTGDLLMQDVVDFINGLDIGEDSYTARLYSPANLGGEGLGATFVVTNIQQAKVADGLSTADVVIAFNEGAIIDLSHVTLVLV